RGLKTAAGNEARTNPLSEKCYSRKRGRVVEGAITPQEFPPVAGPRYLSSSQVRKGDTGTERHVPGVARKHRAGLRIEFRHDRKCGRAAGWAEHPLDIRRDRKPPGSARRVPDRQPRDLDRIIERHVLEEIERDTVCGVLESTVALAVPGGIRRGLVTDRQRRRSP